MEIWAVWRSYISVALFIRLKFRKQCSILHAAVDSETGNICGSCHRAGFPSPGWPQGIDSTLNSVCQCRRNTRRKMFPITDQFLLKESWQFFSLRKNIKKPHPPQAGTRAENYHVLRENRKRCHFRSCNHNNSITQIRITCFWIPLRMCGAQLLLDKIVLAFSSRHAFSLNLSPLLHLLVWCTDHSFEDFWWIFVSHCTKFVFLYCLLVSYFQEWTIWPTLFTNTHNGWKLPSMG